MDPLPYCPDDVIDSARLRGHGLTSHDIARLCRAGALHQLVRGWFATRPPRDAVDRHLLTARALTRHFDGRAVPSHHSRLLAVGLPVWRADLAVVHLTRVTDRGSRRRAGFTVHPAVDGLDAVTMPRRDGVPVGVPVAVAIVQTGILNGPMDALIAADAALRAGLVDEPGIAAALELFAGRTGVAPVRAALAHADARHESPGETRLAGVLRDLSLPATPQVWIRTQQGSKRVDLLLDEHAVVLEFDGAVKYRTPADTGQPDARTDNPLFEEKEREDAIRDEHFEVVRVVWRQLADPGGIHRRILAAIARCTRRAA